MKTKREIEIYLKTLKQYPEELREMIRALEWVLEK